MTYATSPTGQRCVPAVSLHVLIMWHLWRDRSMNRVKWLNSTGGTQNILVDHLFQYRISPWPKTAEKRVFCTCVMDRHTDGRTDGLTDGQTDRPSYRDVRTHLKSRKTWFLHRQTLLWRCEDASKNAKTAQLYHSCLLPYVRQQCMR